MSPQPQTGEDSCCYLTDLSPKDKPWDKHKYLSRHLQKLYQGTVLDRLAGRIEQCSGFLGFGWASEPSTGELTLKLKEARFCRVRQCPICQWRRSLMWVARFLKALPTITSDHPKARWIMLTLTVRNCPVTELRSALKGMGQAWKRLTERKDFPAIGFVRSTEVTRGKDGSAHPHFHALLMVPGHYFQGRYYLSQEKWTELWRNALRVAYTPVVDVRTVKPNSKRSKTQNEGAMDAIAAGIVEVLKYSVKPEDLIGDGKQVDQQWLLELTSQLHKTRAVSLGGVLKNYLSEAEPEDLIGENDAELIDKNDSVWFGWRDLVSRYVKLKE